MQVGLAELWKSWGVHPSAVLGHSVSEIAAACVAGLFSLEQGAQITALRARFMEGCARGEGRMLAVGLDEEEAQALIDKHDQTISIAAFNGPRSLTLAGPRHSIEAMFAELETQGVFARLVRVDHPFHHAMMQPASEALENALADLAPQPETFPLFSTITGNRLNGNAGDAAHWARGIRQPVQFAPAINAIADFGVDIWLELGAHPALAHSIAECLASRGGSKPIVISSVRREREHDSVLEAAMDLHRAGAALDFKAMTPSRRILPLPVYAWDRSRWWNEAPDWRESRLGSGGRGMLDMRLPRATPTWTARLDSRHMAFLKDHKVENHVVFPAAGFVDLVIEAGTQLFEGRPFVVEEFEIRKPLILPEPAAGIHIEVSYEPNERTFAIQSRFDQGTSWSLHVVGSMRAERTESGFADSSFDTEIQPVISKLKSVDIDAFYRYMSDLGLGYGETFRSVRELCAADGESSGRVALSESIAPRAGEYPLHPVLLDGALDDVLATRGRERLKSAIAAQDDLAAVLLCAGLGEMGATIGADFTADSLRVAVPMRPVFEQLMLKLQKRGLVESSGSGYQPNPAFTTAAESANEAQRQFITEHPGHLPEAQLVAGNCAELGPILRGEKDAVQVLFAGAGAELLDHFYGDGLLTSHWLAAISAAVREAAHALPEGRGLRILEVGAGTGGLSAQVLPALERGLHSYTFTDVSAAFFSGAHQKLANFPEVETRIFDLEKSAVEQGFELGSFDFIIGTNVLHAVANIRASLRNPYDLLAPGRYLAL